MYVDDNPSHLQAKIKDGGNQHVWKGSINRTLKSRKKSYKVWGILRRQNEDIFTALLSSKSERELYLGDSIQNEIS